MGDLLNFGRIFMLRKTLFVAILLILVPLLGLACNAATVDDYAPILYFEKEEKCYPVDISYYLDNCNSTPSSITIEGKVILYYDNLLGTVNDNGIIDAYQQKFNAHDSLVYPPTVYYHQYTDTASGTTVVQYWFFYVFNPGEQNRHEGDWEMVQVVIPSSGDKWVGYSQHYSGEKATWNLVEKEGGHIKVYVARGSHANYLRSYSGKFGMANDVVADNGKILNPGDYTLVELNSQDWLNLDVLWGEVKSVQDFALGRAGPQGPMFRKDMNGNKMWDGLSWGNSLLQASDMLFTLEWFLYNFVTIVILVTVLILLLILVRIYFRHKKYGLGPRILSMLYIDGFNLKSIGNILCFVGIIIAVIGLIGSWYVVSAGVNVGDYQTQGMTDVISVHGLNGIQISMPGVSGPIPMGSVSLPFSIVLLVGLFLMILATIGISRSRKLGLKYLFRGIRFIVIIVILVAAIMAIGLFAGAGSSDSGSDNYVSDLFKQISSKPFGGEYAFTMNEQNVTGNVNVKWGIGSGAVLVLVSGVIFLVAGILEIVDNKEFFVTKIPEKSIFGRRKPPVVQQPPPQNISKPRFCPECGNRLEERATFCPQCGTKLE